jgi:hypothetical protein
MSSHIPSLMVSGSIVTVDANVAILSASVEEYELVSGIALFGSEGNIASSTGALSPIVFRLPSGTHDIVTFGFFR